MFPGQRLTLLTVACMVAVITNSDLSSALEERSAKAAPAATVPNFAAEAKAASPNVQGGLQNIVKTAQDKLRAAEAKAATKATAVKTQKPAAAVRHSKKKETAVAKKKEGHHKKHRKGSHKKVRKTPKKAQKKQHTTPKKAHNKEDKKKAVSKRKVAKKLKHKSKSAKKVTTKSAKKVAPKKVSSTKVAKKKKKVSRTKATQKKSKRGAHKAKPKKKKPPKPEIQHLAPRVSHAHPGHQGAAMEVASTELWQTPPQRLAATTETTGSDGSPSLLLSYETPKALAYPASVALVTRSNFAEQRRLKGTVIMEFYAPWCPHCQREAPTYGRVADSLSTPTLHFAAVNCVAQSKLCHSQKLIGFPTFKIMRNDKTICTLAGGLEEAGLRFLINRVSHSKGRKTECPSMDEVLRATRTNSGESSAPPANPKQRHSLVPVGRVKPQDLAAAVHFAWGHTTFSGTASLSGARLAAMRATLRAIAKLPGTKTRAALLRLEGVLKTQKRWSQKEFHRLTQKVKLWGHDATVQFDVCKGTQHGLACGLWQLFHTIMRYAPYKQAISAVRGFVKYFFDCVPCQRHFAVATKGMSRLNLSREAAMLALWKIHNRVSVRLAPSYNLAPDKVIYPPRSACTSCRRASPGIAFNTSAVAAFLRRTYAMTPKHETLQDAVLQSRAARLKYDALERSEARRGTLLQQEFVEEDNSISRLTAVSSKKKQTGAELHESRPHEAEDAEVANFFKAHEASGDDGAQ